MANNPNNISLRKKHIRSVILPGLNLLGQWPGLPAKVRAAIAVVLQWVNLP